jgi:guanylate kinase
MAYSLATMANMQGKLVLIMGPSGVGKSAILRHLREQYPELHFPRSATTRARRAGEGDDLYQFVNNQEFDALLANNKVLEWATVHGGARYGTLVDEIIPAIENGKTVVREVDVQGFDSIRKHDLFNGTPPPYRLESIFILPESTEQLIAHITKRAPMAEEELKRRIASVEKELAFAPLCHTQIINHEGQLDATIRAVTTIVTRAE